MRSVLIKNVQLYLKYRLFNCHDSVDFNNGNSFFYFVVDGSTTVVAEVSETSQSTVSAGVSSETTISSIGMVDVTSDEDTEVTEPSTIQDLDTTTTEKATETISGSNAEISTTNYPVTTSVDKEEDRITTMLPETDDSTEKKTTVASGDKITTTMIPETSTEQEDSTLSNFIEDSGTGVTTTKLPVIVVSTAQGESNIESSSVPEVIATSTADAATTTIANLETSTIKKQDTTMSNLIDNQESSAEVTTSTSIADSSMSEEESDEITTKIPAVSAVENEQDILVTTNPTMLSSTEKIENTTTNVTEDEESQDSFSSTAKHDDLETTSLQPEENIETTDMPAIESSSSDKNEIDENEVTTSKSIVSTSSATLETTISNFIEDVDINPETTELPASVTTTGASPNDVEEIATASAASQTTFQPASEEASEQQQVTTTSNIVDETEGLQITTQKMTDDQEPESDGDDGESESNVPTAIDGIDDVDLNIVTTQKSEPEEGSGVTEEDIVEESITTQSSSENLTETIDDVETTVKPLVHHTSTQAMLEMENTESSSTVQPSTNEISTESESTFSTIINTIMTTIAPDMFASTQGQTEEETSSSDGTPSNEISSEPPVTTIVSETLEEETTPKELVSIETENEIATDAASVIEQEQSTEQSSATEGDAQTITVPDVSVETTFGPPQMTTTIAEVTTVNKSEIEVIQVSEEATTERLTTTESDTTTQVMSFCIESGMVIQSGKVVPNSDPCKRCVCDNGKVVCSTRECPPKPEGNCSPLPIEDGQCCPKYTCIDEQEIQDDDSEDISFENNVRIRPDELSTDQNKTVEATETVTAPTYPPTFQEVTNVTDDKVQPTSLSPSTGFPTTTTASTTTTTHNSTTSFVPTSMSTITSSPETSSIDSLNEEDTSVYGTASSDFSDEETTTSSVDEYIPDYPFYPDDGQLTLDDLDKIGPGACLFDGKVYVSAQQIPRENPCDFCFCFRGDIICLQQSCPPPIPGCREEIIGGFCCPRYECPVKMATHNITVPAPTTLPSLSSFLFGGSNDQDPPPEIQQQISGCEVNGNFYETGAIVEESSSPCLQCR